MKYVALVVFLISATFFAQQVDYNTKKGYAAEGYDVVAYFNNEAVEGDTQFYTDFDGAKYKFASGKNLVTFKLNPEKFIPQYGGYCAYAMADKGEKVGIDPKTYIVTEGKLYLFYNSWGTNTLKLWNKGDTKTLKQKADKNWTAVLNKE
jgi:YHS domain-containing protein